MQIHTDKNLKLSPVTIGALRAACAATSGRKTPSSGLSVYIGAPSVPKTLLVLTNIPKGLNPYHTLGLSETFVGLNEIRWDMEIEKMPIISLKTRFQSKNEK
jgi:hypothetical protein